MGVRASSSTLLRVARCSSAEFRSRHLHEFKVLFVRVLQLCQQAGLVKLGHVAPDGTRVRANASKHKAMSYGRMKQQEARLTREIEELLKEAERIDSAEYKRYGKGKRGDELPAELACRENRYGLRKQTVEPVFGQIKSCIGVRQFLVRGLAKVKAEWALICLCHNMRKLYMSSLATGQKPVNRGKQVPVLTAAAVDRDVPASRKQPPLHRTGSFPHETTTSYSHRLLGCNHFDELNRNATVRRVVRRLEALGYKVTLQETAQDSPGAMTPMGRFSG